MKTCSKCSEAKPLYDYFIRDKSTGRLHSQCKACYKEQRAITYSIHYHKYGDYYRKRALLRRKKLRTEFRQNMLMYLADKACVICGESDIRVLELDHIDPINKKFTIAKAVSLGFSWKVVLEEIQKCQILCANCHKKRTAQQFKWYKAN